MRAWMLVALGAVACEAPAEGPGPAEGQVAEVDCAGATAAATVEMIDITYQPSEVQVRVGDVVRFVNREAILHDVYSGSPDDPNAGALFSSPDMLEGDEYCLKFDSEGSFDFWCTYHPQVMQGVVQVQPAEGG